MEVFECCKEGEEENFTNVGNRYITFFFGVIINKETNLKINNERRVLLWHGSRLTNWAGILKRGLQIAPSEAPVTGYMVCCLLNCFRKIAINSFIDVKIPLLYSLAKAYTLQTDLVKVRITAILRRPRTLVYYCSVR